MNSNGRSLELYFVDGRPDGMLTAEVFNWTGHVLRMPRTKIKEGLARKEVQHTGVYILIGEIDGVLTAYIGEAESLGTRLSNHIRNKDWWELAVLITSTADSLHKAHVKYLEARMIRIASELGRCKLQNGNAPEASSLNEAATSNMESFLETVRMVLPAIGIDFFLDKKVGGAFESKPHDDLSAPGFILKSTKRDVEAHAELVDGEMIVKAGSRASASWNGVEATYTELYLQLVANGTLVRHGEVAELASDYAFSSPSAAAAVFLGRSANGRKEWRHKETGQTFAEWESKQIAELEDIE